MSDGRATQAARPPVAAAGDGQGDQSGVVAGYHGGKAMPLAAFTRLIASVYSVESVSDYLQLAYSAAKKLE